MLDTTFDFSKICDAKKYTNDGKSDDDHGKFQ